MVYSACAHCQAPFEPYPGKVYCSTRCKRVAAESRRVRTRRKLRGFECRGCGEWASSTHAHTRYCSLDCRRAVEKRVVVVRVCQECGCESIGPPVNWRCCSPACRWRRPAPSPRGKRDKVYLIQCGRGPIKIGVAGDPEDRRRKLQVAHYENLRTLAVFDGGLAFERELHRRFAAARIRGEWFEPIPEILALASTSGGVYPPIESSSPAAASAMT